MEGQEATPAIVGAAASLAGAPAQATTSDGCTEAGLVSKANCELGVRSPGIEAVDTQITEATTHRAIWVFLVSETETVDTQTAVGPTVFVVPSLHGDRQREL